MRARFRLPTSAREVAVSLLLLAGIMLVRVAYYRVRARMTESWKPVTAVVTHSQIGERQITTRSGSQVTEYSTDIIYVYTVGGKDHAGTQVYPGGGPWERSQKNAAGLVARYTPGARVLAHYNPAKPDHAVLIRGTPQLAQRETLIAVASVLGAMVAYALGR